MKYPDGVKRPRAHRAHGEFSQVGSFIKVKTISERVKREITNLYRRHWRTTKSGHKSGKLHQNPPFTISSAQRDLLYASEVFTGYFSVLTWV